MRLSDWLLLLGCLGLLLGGPAMALQELSEAHQAEALSGLTGEPTPPDLTFRAPWRAVLLGLVLWVGVLGTIVSLRVARHPKVRPVTGRLVALLLSGLALADLAFLVDGRYFQETPPVLRASTIVWLYPAAAVLVGASALRLAQIEAFFGTRAPTASAVDAARPAPVPQAELDLAAPASEGVERAN